MSRSSLTNVIAPAGGAPADWQRVCRAEYEVRHAYRYTYATPIADLRQRLVMIPPPAHGDQRLLSHSLEVTGAGGAATITWERDPFGNRVCHVHAARVEETVAFEVRYRVERRGHGSAPRAAARDVDRYTRPTALTAPDPRLEAAAREIAGRWASPRDRAERAHDWAAGAITFQVGVTGVQTPAAMALHLGRGVCQDYTHILLSLLRLLGIPARYVSGHLLGDGVPHAWVEALVESPDAPGAVEVVPYDPTHRRRAGLGYITVAVGRDFADVTPTSGSFTGPAAGKFSWSKQAAVAEIEYARGEGMVQAAG